jgi:nucleoid DNA-binding protein
MVMGNIAGVATASNQNRPDARFKIPAKTVVKFRVAKAAKDAVLGAKK